MALISARCTSARLRKRAATWPRSTQNTLTPVTAAALSISARLRSTFPCTRTERTRKRSDDAESYTTQPAPTSSASARTRASAQTTKPGGSSGSRCVAARTARSAAGLPRRGELER